MLPVRKVLGLDFGMETSYSEIVRGSPKLLFDTNASTGT
jgi:hypothetical protein